MHIFNGRLVDIRVALKNETVFAFFGMVLSGWDTSTFCEVVSAGLLLPKLLS